MKPTLKKYLQIILKLLVSGVALYYVLHNTDLAALKRLIFRSNLALLVAGMVFFILSKIISSYRLNLFFRAKDIHISDRSNLKLYWLGMFYNLFLPGGVGGDGYKVYYLNRNMGTPVKKGLLVIFFDRVTGLFALVMLCLVFAFFMPDFVRPYQIAVIIVCSILLFYYVVYKWFGDFFKVLNKTNVQSFGVQIAQLICAWLILRAMGHEAQATSYLFVFLISSVVAVIPFTIGGVGARELTFLYASDLLSLDLATAISLSLLFFMITALVSLAGIIYVIKPELINQSVLQSQPDPVNDEIDRSA